MKLNTITCTSSLWVDELPSCLFCGDPCEPGGAYDQSGAWQTGAHVWCVTGGPAGISDSPLCEHCAHETADGYRKNAELQRKVDNDMRRLDEALARLNS